MNVGWGGDIEKGLAKGLRFDEVNGACRDAGNGIDWLRLSFTRARQAFIAGGDAISSRHEGDGRRIQNVRLFPHLLERSMVEWICAPARSFRTAFLLSLRRSVQQTDALRVFQNGEFVGYDSLIREFLVRHSTFQCAQLCIRGKFRGDKKQLSERGCFHAVVSLPMFWRARGL